MIISYLASSSVLESTHTYSLPCPLYKTMTRTSTCLFLTSQRNLPLLSSSIDSRRISILVHKRACKWTVYTNQLPGTQKTKHFNVPLALFTGEKNRDELMDDCWQNIKMRGINKAAPRPQEREAI